ncbi:hypothetical protein BGZ65_001584 [Modicella reniformis]|uniref:Inhibitor I9 domain-containing protein n=1 Tax=Modicella reniformis TaxID=1440133 RepID=A0A9P6J1N8_9FUNG|nr:hypothetical protein BGZ65_001584 [Modicella reniformis]
MSAGKKVIVVFKEDTPQVEIDNAITNFQQHGGQVTQKYESALLGFAGVLPEVSTQAVQALEAHPGFDYMEDDAVMTTQ